MSQEFLKDKSSPSHCTILLSGGIDSAACVDFYRRQQFTVDGLHVSYGQAAARRESLAAAAIADYYRISLIDISMVGARPKLESEFLGRNALFLFTALLELKSRPAIVAIGIHSGTPYYDCSSSFLSAVQAIVDGQCSGQVRVAAPFLDWTKKQIWQYSMETGVPLELTYSCELGEDRPCGVCLTCRDLEAIRAG